jgi:hypothetical protein
MSFWAQTASKEVKIQAKSVKIAMFWLMPMLILLNLPNRQRRPFGEFGLS